MSAFQALSTRFLSVRKKIEKKIFCAIEKPKSKSVCHSKKVNLSKRKKTAAKKQSLIEILFFGTIHLASGFIFGCAELPFSIYPCGTALILASDRFTFPAYIGACFSIISHPSDSAEMLAANTLAFFARGFLTSYNFDEKRKTKFFTACAISLLYGTVIAVAGGFEFVFVMKGALYTIVLPIITLVLSRSETKKSKSIAVNGSFCAVCYIVVFALARVADFRFSPAVFLSSVIVLFTACGAGAVYGLLAGLICGIACSGTELSSVYAMSFGIAGFAAGMYDKSKKIFCIFRFISVFSAVLAFSDGLSADYSNVLAAVICGSVLFFPLAEFVPQFTVNRYPVFPSSAYLFEKSDYERISSAFSSISDIVYNVNDKLKYPSDIEVREMVRSVIDSECSKCALRERCYSLKLYEKENAEDIICIRLQSGGLERKDLPDKYAESCIKLSDTVTKLNDGYASLINDHFRDNKTEILASEYNSMARLLKYTSQKVKTDNVKDALLEEKARCALAAIGIRFSAVCAYGTRMKTIDVKGVRADRFPCTSKELSDYMSEKCGYLFSEPEFIGLGEKMTMRFKRMRKIKLEYSRAACAKGGNGVNGDSISFFESDEDFFYALISDGMGSGRSAALTSRLTSIFLEKLLTTGTHKTVTLEMLNNLLLSKNDESFATVDLLEIDLLSGDASFIKAGAAPAYIMRASKLYKIASFTPPAGIIRSFNAESTKFSLEKGDTVLMLSDGVVQSSDDAPWLCEMLSENSRDDPSQLCDRIMSKAKSINLREDDMTCAAVKVL